MQQKKNGGVSTPNQRRDQDLPLGKRLAFWAIFLFGSILIALGLIETFLRASLDIYQCDPRVGWTFEKGGGGIKFSRDQEFFEIHKFDSRGLRQSHRESEIDDNGPLIYLLGDSMTAGLQVSDENLFSTIVEQDLNGALEPDVEIVNAAIDGFGATQELLLLKEMMEDRTPDLVVLQIFINNDLADNWPAIGNRNHWIAARCGRPYLKSDDTGESLISDGQLLRPSMPSLHRFLSASILYSILVPYPPQVEGEDPGIEPKAMWEPNNLHETERAWNHFIKTLSEFEEMLDEQKIKLVYLLIPSREDAGQGKPNENRQKYYERLKSRFEEKNLWYIDTLPAIREHLINGGMAPYFAIDDHLNERGHRVVASAIEEWITRHCALLGLGNKACSSSGGFGDGVDPKAQGEVSSPSLSIESTMTELSSTAVRLADDP